MKMTLEKNGMRKEVKQGFSWTTLFFGCFVPLFRGDLKWAIIMFLLAFMTLGLSWLIMPFIYNKKYLEELLNNGWKVI